jgi:hypothetical protein
MAVDRYDHCGSLNTCIQKLWMDQRSRLSGTRMSI